MAEVESLDRAALDNLFKTVGEDRAFLAELLESYFEDTPGQLELMRTALEAGNADDLRRAAHTLKSNSASFGATALSSLCRDLEALGKSGELAGASSHIEQIEREYARVRHALQAAGLAIQATSEQ